MTTARAFEASSHEDIYSDLDEREPRDNAIPSCRRVTIPAMPRAKLLSREQEKSRSELPVNPPRVRMMSHAVAIPEHSERRLKAASVRVSGAPDVIEEPVTEAILRDPRRD